MKRLASWLEALPLRRRFLVAPIVGLVLFALVAAGFITESQRQNALMERLSEEDVGRLNQLSGIFVVLAQEHMGLFALLHDARHRLDEATLYERAKTGLDRIRAAAADLDRALASPEPLPAAAERRKAMREGMTAYRKRAAEAVEMATVNLDLAAQRLVVANDRFVAMNQAFTALLDGERQALRDEALASVRRNRIGIALVAAAGLAVGVGLLLISLLLSRLLARSLEARLQELTALGQAAGADFAPAPGADQVAGLEAAIAAFRTSLARVREHEGALVELNQALEASRDELELRVADRTRALLASESRLRALLEAAPDAVVISGPGGRIVLVNAEAERLFGYRRDELVGQPVERLIPERFRELHQEHRDRYRENPASRTLGGGMELIARRRDGSEFPVDISLSPIRTDDGLWVFSDIRDATWRKQAEQQLHRLAFFDPLTGLANRALFADHLAVALARAKRGGDGLAVMYLDLDRFKHVNDTLGHPAGDQLLVEISRRLGAVARAEDTIARFGGDEFTLLLDHLKSEDDAHHIAERLIEVVGQPVAIGGEVASVGASIGLAFFPGDGEDVETLLKCADLALYEAKRSGRSRWR